MAGKKEKHKASPRALVWPQTGTLCAAQAYRAYSTVIREPRCAEPESRSMR